MNRFRFLRVARRGAVDTTSPRGTRSTTLLFQFNFAAVVVGIIAPRRSAACHQPHSVPPDVTLGLRAVVAARSAQGYHGSTIPPRRSDTPAAVAR